MAYPTPLIRHLQAIFGASRDRWPRLVCYMVGHQDYVEFTGANPDGPPCHFQDSGECMFDVGCRRCKAVIVMTGNEIKHLPATKRFDRFRVMAELD